MYESGDYRAKNPTWHAEDAPWKASWIAEMWRRHLIGISRVVEVGCGTGRVLSELARNAAPGTTFDGYDISADAIELASERAGGALRFHQGDLTLFPGEPADLLLAIDVIEHVEDVFGFLRRLRARARHTILHIPLDLSVSSLLRRWVLPRSRVQVGHLHYFTLETALATVRHCGFEVIDWRITPGCLVLPGKTWKRRLMNVPRSLGHVVAPELTARTLGGFSVMVLCH